MYVVYEVGTHTFSPFMQQYKCTNCYETFLENQKSKSNFVKCFIVKLNVCLFMYLMYLNKIIFIHVFGTYERSFF
jgi:hypothetical protein